MTETEFGILATERGHGELRVVEFPPVQRPDMHAHEWSTLLLLTEGEMTMVYEDCSVELAPGDWCEVAAGELHSECAGPDGATALIATHEH